jgi:hypothetical protein
MSMNVRLELKNVLRMRFARIPLDRTSANALLDSKETVILAAMVSWEPTTFIFQNKISLTQMWMSAIQWVRTSVEKTKYAPILLDPMLANVAKVLQGTKIQAFAQVLNNVCS